MVEQPTSSTLLRSRWRWLGWVAGGLVLYALLGFFVAPPIARQQLAHHLSAALGGRAVTVEQVRINPFALSVTVRGLSVADHDGHELLGWDELYANLRAASLFARGFLADEVRWVRPRVRLEIDVAGALNIADLLPPPAEFAASSPDRAPAAAAPLREQLPPAAINRFELQSAEIVFVDGSRTAPFETRVGPMTFTLENFSTRHDDEAPYTFHGETEAGERFAWSGGVTLAPLGSVGRVAFERISAAKYAPYYADFVHFEIPTGWLSFASDYVAVLGNATQLRLDRGTIELDDFALRAPGAAGPVVVAPAMRVEGLALDLAGQTLAVGSVLLTGGAVEFVRTADGRFELVELLTPRLPPSRDEAARREAPAEPSPWTARIGELTLEDCRVAWADHATDQPVRLELDSVRLRMTDLGTVRGVNSAVTAGLRWAGGGWLEVDGAVVLEPLAGTLNVSGEGMALRPLAPYLEPWADVLLASGAVGLRGAAQVAPVAAGSEAAAGRVAEWRGDITLEQLVVLEGEGVGSGEVLLALGALRLEGVKATTEPPALEVREIVIVDPVVRLRLDEEGNVNVLAALRSPMGEGTADSLLAPEVPAAAPAGGPRPEVRVGQVTVSGGRMGLQDRSVAPAFATELREFGGTIKGLSSAQLARADVALAGRLDGVSPLTVTGQINPLSEEVYTNLEVRFGGVDLTAFTPYTGRWLGYAVERGQLSLAIDYRLSRRELVGENRVTFDRFYLGDAVESPDAVRLPIKLALALLRDRQGRIALDVPVRGHLDDPQFRYGRVVWQAVGNLVTRAATAPFALLGSMFGGRGEELGFQEFASGSAALAPEGIQKLETLAQALTERPELNLEIIARPEPALDRPGLRAARLDAWLRSLRGQELARATGEVVDPAAIVLDKATTARLIAQAYAVAFPAGAEGDDRETPLGVEERDGAMPPPAAAEARGSDGFFLVRATRWLFGRSDRVASGPADGPEAAPAGVAADGGELGERELEEMRERLLARIEVSLEDFRQLGRERANALRDWLVNTGGVEPGRIDVRSAEELVLDTTTPRDRPRVDFALR
jgi:hypothetical protein